MKKLTFVLIMFAIVAMDIMIVISCKKDDDEDTIKKECQDASTACGTFTACCTATDCYYIFDGNRYDCDGTDCSDAAIEVANDMCDSRKSGGAPCVTVEELLNALPCNK